MTEWTRAARVRGCLRINRKGRKGRVQTLTTASVLPVLDGRGELDRIIKTDGTPLGPNELNPSFGKPTSFQAPRQLRFGAKVTF